LDLFFEKFQINTEIQLDFIKIMKRIRITKHCEEQMQMRDIDRKDILKIIRNPIETVYDSERDNYKSVGMGTNPPIKEQQYLLIVHNTLKNKIVVITSMWKGKGSKDSWFQ